MKRLIASCYVDQSYNLFTINEEREPAVWADYDGWLVNGRVPEVSEIKVMELKGDGDFKSQESVELLKQADIVVTNPPFSLFRQFIPLMMKCEKKFLVIGNFNAITYKNIFSLIKDSKMWVGSTPNGIGFYLPSGEITEVNAVWWTNIDKAVKHEHITLTKVYKGNEDKYPKYDNYDAINVDKVAEIPKDYSGTMGVPIGLIGRWNPDQFEIVGQGQGHLYRSINGKGLSKKFADDYYASGGKGTVVEGHPFLGYYDSHGKAKVPYMRILIRNKKVDS